MNKRWLHPIRNLALAFALVFPAAGYAAPEGLSQKPVFLSPSAKHNLAFVIDDSRHMDMEVQMNGVDYGRLESDGWLAWLGQLLDGVGDDEGGLQQFADNLLGDLEYGYIYEPGATDSYDGRRVNKNMEVVPPIPPFAFMRSSAYNGQFYDPSKTYEPWVGSASDAADAVKTVDGETVYANASTEDPRLDPHYDRRFSTLYTDDFLANLVSNASEFFSNLECAVLGFFGSDCPEPTPFTEMQIAPYAMTNSLVTYMATVAKSANTTVTVAVEDAIGNVYGSGGSVLEELGSSATCNVDALSSELFSVLGGDGLSNYVCVAYTPATYYVVESRGSYHLDFENLGEQQVGSCSAPNPEHYREYYNPNQSTVQQLATPFLSFREPNGNEFEGALAPDGRCLRKITLNEDVSGQTFHGGTSYERTYAEELQNFANWFTYHRRRHQSVKASVGESVQDLRGLRAAAYPTSVSTDNSSSIEALKTMDDLNTQSGRDAFLADVYNTFNGVDDQDAPLRNALYDTGEQFSNSDADGPITQACQKNFALLYSDGYADDTGFSEVDNTDNSVGVPFQDGISSTLADVAYHYRTQDLSNLENKVPTDPGCATDNPDPSLDCNSGQHLNTFVTSLGGVGESVYHQPAADGTLWTRVGDAFQNHPEWPATEDVVNQAGAPAQLDDYYHAAVNGLGDAYDARFPDQITEAINRAVEVTDGETGAAAPVTFNESRVTATSMIYGASFDTRRWSGELTAWNLNTSGGKLVQGEDGSYVGAVEWRASKVLDDRKLASNPRDIVTYNPVTDESVPFRWDELTPAQKSDLSGPGQGQDRLAYLRGDRGEEGDAFRQRDSRLGDIVNSGPVYVDRPRMAWPSEDPFGTEGARYVDFKNQQQDRAPTIYVGANDGMLHAFNAEDGEERWAYVPDLAFDENKEKGLSYLTRPSYGHRYYVDLTPAVVDVFIDTGAGDQWHSVLLGGMRAGSRGLFALDVTDPTAMNEMNAEDLALWEFGHPKLGHLTQPVNVMLTDWSGSMEWVAVFGNGYDPKTPSAGVFMLRLEGGLDGTWTEGDDYRYIEVASGDDTLGMTSDIRLWDTDQGDDMPGDRLYAGDRGGNLWVFEPSGGTWQSAYADNSGNAEPLFTSADGQPITAAPKVVTNPDGTSAGTEENLLVLFGTGKYLSQSDLTDTTTQSFYGVWDTGEADSLTRDDLLARDITETSNSGSTTRTLSDDELTWSTGNGGQAGWYIDFDDSDHPGERVVQSADVRNETILFNTTIPPTQESCTQDATSFRMFVDLDGTNPDQAIFDLNGDGLVNDGDLGDDGSGIAGVFHGGGNLSGSRILGSVLFDNNAGGSASSVPNSNRVAVPPPFAQGRQGWRELINR